MRQSPNGTMATLCHRASFLLLLVGCSAADSAPATVKPNVVSFDPFLKQVSNADLNLVLEDCRTRIRCTFSADDLWSVG